ncbi:MAG: DUF4476 domain-containing protein [Bacteroidota bacterium]
MKHLVALFALFTGYVIIGFAQTNNAILFTENGETFQVILNGILQNAKPETNVRMTQLAAPSYKCRILFSDTKLGYIDFNMFFNEMGEEVTWNIKQNKKGEYVTRWISAVPLAQAPPPTPAQTVVVYSATPAVTTTTTTVQQTQTSTSTGNGMGNDNVNINMGFNVGGEGGSISINASGTGMGMDVDTYESSGSMTTTTTTTTTHSTSNNPAPSRPSQVIYVTGYNGPIGCPVPMTQGEFNSFKESIRSKDFEDTKLKISKQVIQSNCLTSQQVKVTMGLFDFESTRLELAKFAYGHTYDIGNYYKVNDAFEFESSVDDLSRAIGN